MDNFREEIIVKKNRTLDSLLYMLVWVLIVVTGLVALFFLQGTLLQMNFDLIGIAIGVGFGALCFFLYRVKDRFRMEYEYIFTNGELDFAQVLGNEKRKELGCLKVRNVDACGYVTGASFQRYLSMPNVRKDNWFLNREANLFYFYFVKDSAKRLIVLEPSPEMVEMIKKYLTHGVFQA